jgi:transposase InsO family protein
MRKQSHSVADNIVERAMQMPLNLKQPIKEMIFHSDRDSQYTSHRFQ